MSFDASGRQRSQGEQHADNARAAEAHGWTLHSQYRDTGSASRYASKDRAGFDRLLADLRSSRFGASVLMLWEPSRLSRKVGVVADLLELCASSGIMIYVTSHARLYDPQNHRDWRTLIEESVDSEYESRKTSARAKRNRAADAESGQPHGKTPYGYRRVRTVEGKTVVVRQIPHDEEAKLVRELFDRIASRHSLRSIAKDWEARGVRRRSGKPFTDVGLRQMALSRVHIGQRVYDPGRKGHRLSDQARFFEGSWPALVDKSTFYTVQTILGDATRRTHRDTRARHLLSMTARCGVCGDALTFRRMKGYPVYQCRGAGCVSVDHDELDRIVEDRIIRYLSREDVYAMLAAATVDESELQAARDEVAVIRAELDDLARQVGSGALSATLAARAEPAILTRLDAAERRVTALSAPPALAWLTGRRGDIAGRWQRAAVAQKRAAVRLLCQPELVGEVRVTRVPQRTVGERFPVADRVRWITR